jgi:hypothetical protein
MLYFLAISPLFSSPSDFMYTFHPGQKLMCHLQNLPANDFGFSSYLIRMVQFSQLFSAIVDLIYWLYFLFYIEIEHFMISDISFKVVANRYRANSRWGSGENQVAGF